MNCGRLPTTESTFMHAPVCGPRELPRPGRQAFPPSALVAERRAGIRERAAGDRHELPVVTVRMERRRQDSERAPLPIFAERLQSWEGLEVFAAGADHELAYARRRIVVL